MSTRSARSGRGGEAKIFFPWERRRGPLGFIARVRGRLAVVAVLVIVTVVFAVRRERHAARVRATRAAIGDVSRAVLAYRAMSGGKCPGSLDDLSRSGALREVPLDAWARPLRLVCPGRKDHSGFEVLSDGPDGEPFGLDRVE